MVVFIRKLCIRGFKSQTMSYAVIAMYAKAMRLSFSRVSVDKNAANFAARDDVFPVPGAFVQENNLRLTAYDIMPPSASP